MLRKHKKLKFSTRIDPAPFEVVEKKSMIFTLLQNGEYVARNISQLKSVKGDSLTEFEDSVDEIIEEERDVPDQPVPIPIHRWRYPTRDHHSFSIWSFH